MPRRAYVVTIHNQKAYLADGDWIIVEPDGVHHYPCKPDIFAATYEPADTPTPSSGEELSKEFAAWDAASDADLSKFENGSGAGYPSGNAPSPSPENEERGA